MGKKINPYVTISLQRQVMEAVEKQIIDNWRYVSITDFVRRAIIEKIDRERNK